MKPNTAEIIQFNPNEITGILGVSGHSDNPKEDARLIVEAIAKGEIPHVTISY